MLEPELLAWTSAAPHSRYKLLPVGAQITEGKIPADLNTDRYYMGKQKVPWAHSRAGKV